MAFCALAINILKYAYMAVMAMLGIASRPVIMHAVFTLLGLFCIAMYIYKSMLKSLMTRREVTLLGIIVMFFIFFMITPIFKYGYENDIYRSMYLTFGSASVPAYLMGILIKKNDKLEEIGKWIPPFSLIMTAACLAVALNPSSATSGGYVMDESGFDYQALSYTAAYTFGLTFYYVHYCQSLPQFKMFQRKGWKIVLYACMLMQALTVVLAGGRGGFLVLAIFALYYIFISSKNTLSAVKRIILVMILAVAALKIAEMLNIETAGYERILASLSTGGSDSQREIIRNQAMEVANKHMFFGTGLGSIFYEIGIYSHNIFVDILCETGSIGLIIFCCILLAFALRLRRLILKNPLNHLVAILFLCGFIMLLFSNYYVAVPFIWFAFGYVFADGPMKKQSGGE